VLAVWTDSSATPSMCDGTLTNLIADDQGATDPTTGNFYSQVSFPIVAGTTYYIEVASYDDGDGDVPNDNAGAYVLNWNAIYPPVPSGAFQFTAGTYTVSQSDSASPLTAYDGDTVDPSVRGARITVTRPAPAYGRVLVDYTVSDLNYKNIFTTNYWGTNILTQITSTDIPPIITISNSYATNVLSINAYQQYDGAYFYTYVTNYFTNSATLTEMVAFTVTNTPPPVAWVPVATNLPFLTNYSTATNFTSGKFKVSISDNVFGYLQSGKKSRGTNFDDGLTLTNLGVVYTNYEVVSINTYITNFFGTNIFAAWAPTAFDGNYYSTNYYYTNMAVGLIYSSNSIYTNGVSVFSTNLTGTNWFVNPALDTSTYVELDFNATNYNNPIGALIATTPAPTNWPTVAFNPPFGTSSDASSNTIVTTTNDFAYSIIVSKTVPSGSLEGIATNSATLTFNNLQMSQDILVPVAESTGPDAPALRNIGGYAQITLSNPRLDPLENANELQTPGISNGLAYLNTLSPNFAPYAGTFNFERSTFRVYKNENGVNGGVATMSVYRVGGNAQDAVTVQYFIDPTTGNLAPNYGGYNPPASYANGYNPGNTFPLQAGSDYATPNSDYTPVSGTLSWGAYDYTPQQITVPILNNGNVEFNEDLFIQLYNPLPAPSSTDPGMSLGQVNYSTLTILFDDSFVLGGQFAGQQPAGAVDRTWNRDGFNGSIPPFNNYPGTTPGQGGTVYAVAEEPDGTAIIAGSFVSYDSTPYNRIVRVLPNGYLDLTNTFFQGNSATLGNNSGANNSIYALALQPNGQILIGGDFTAYNGNNRHYIARLNFDGSLDTTFLPGLGANGTVWAISLQPNGQIIIGGAFTSYNGSAVNQVARLNADGSLDTSFNCGPLGSGANVAVDAVAVDAAGRVLIGGNFSTVAGTPSGAVARLNPDGTLDTTFTPGIGTYNQQTAATDPVKAIALQANGQILIGGSFAYYNLVSQNGLARLNPDGTLDLTFSSGTGTLNPITGDADAVDTILLQPDGNILIGGDFEAYNQTRRIGLARVFTDGSLDTSFMDTAYNEFAGLPNQYFNENAVAATYPYYNTRNAIYSIALETNAFDTASNLVVGGTFEMVGGGTTRNDIHPRSNVARVIGGMTPGPGNLEFSYGSYSVNNSDGSLYVSLDRINGNLGIVAATFATNTAAPGPGVANAGVDFVLLPQYAEPTWDTAWYNGAGAWSYDFGDYGPNYNLSPPQPRGAGATTGNPDVDIDVFNSGNISGDLSANLALTAPVGVFTLGGQYIPLGTALGAQNSAPLTIIDANVAAGVLGFSSPVYSAVEGTVATITLTRTNGSQNQVTVYVATSDGTGVNGTNYQGSTNQITFAIGQTNQTFTVQTLNKIHTIQPDKTVNLSLLTPSGGATLGLSNAILTVVNNQYTPGHLGFSLANYTVNENGGSAVITVNRLGGSTGTLGVTFRTQDLTATNGVNYVGTSTNLLWDTGDATSRNITIPVMDDGLVTPNLVANLILTNSTINGTNNSGPLSYGDAASPTNATLTIVNVDSAGSFQFSLGAYSVKKYAGYALIPVTRTNGSIGTATISFTTMDDTAIAGTNYLRVTNTLTFTNGQVSELVQVPIIDDGTTNNPSGPKDFFVLLSNPTGGATLGTPDPATMYILDSESLGETPGTAESPYTFDFNNTVYALTLQANNQLLVGGNFTFADGVARNRIARLNSDGTLDSGFSEPSDIYGANDSVRAIAVQQDARILVAGAFTNFNGQVRGHIARLSSDGTLDSLFNPGSGADNPVYAVAQTFVSGVSKVLIGGAFATVGGNTFNGVAQLNTDGTPDSTFNAGGLGANNTVYALAVQPDGKIIIGGDFTTYNGLTNFNHLARLNPDGSADTNFNVSGSGPSGSVRAIAIQLDGKIVIGGLFTNVNNSAQPLNYIARLNANGTVDPYFFPGLGANDAVFALGLQSDTRIVVGGEFTDCSGVTRNRITRLNPDGTVDPSINFGTGANNFVAAVAVQEDTVAGYPTNVPNEKIIIGGGFTQYNGTNNPYLARIYGGSISGSGAFQFSSGNYQVNELGTNVTITVLRTGGTTNAATGDVKITAFTGNGGTAVAGINYLAVSTNLDFPLGEVVRTFVIPVMDDGVVTPNLTVNLAITNPTPPAVIGNQPTAVLTIINDDSTVSFSSSTYSVPKNIVSGEAAINIVRLGGTSGTTTVSFATTSGGTAAPTTDYTPTNLTVIFNPGVSNVTVDIPIHNNGIVEGNQTVTMQLSGATGSTLISPTNATLTIIDTVNAPGEFSFASPTYSITEGGGLGYTNVYVTVQRTFGSYGPVSVGFTTFDGTAVAGVKYLATNGVLDFGDGETSKTFPVTVINTATAEGPEFFSVYLFNPTGGASLTSPTNTVVTILNTNTGIAFASATNAFTEPSNLLSGTLLLNVVRFNNTNGTTTVNYSTTNGTAVAGTNFVGITNAILTFNPGDSVKQIAITTIHDPLVTGDLFFTVGLANPSAGAQLTPPSFTVVTDHDADAGIYFATNAASVFRNAGFVILPVICSNTNLEPMSVNYSTGGGTAVAGVDYTATSGTLSFTNDAAVNYIVVPILLNNSVLSNLTFNVTLSAPTAPGVLLPPSSETVTIIGTNTPPGLSFSIPLVISGVWGVTNANNTLGAAESGDPAIAGYPATAPVWFEWTAPPGQNGEVTLDTIGSVSTNGLKLDTVLAVFTGSSLSALNQVAANDDLYPNQRATQVNETVQNIFNTNAAVRLVGYTFQNTINGFTLIPIYFTNTSGSYSGQEYVYVQPYAGPSALRFNATGGTTYYIAADTKSTTGYTISNNTVVAVVAGRGNIQLSWAYHPSGVFRFATEDVEETGISDTNGNPMLLYQCAETEGGGLNGIDILGGQGVESTHRIIGPVVAGDYDTTFHAYYYYDVSGLLVTVTRVAGATGRVMVDYATQDGSTNIINNGDVPALGYVTNIYSFGSTSFTNITTQDYVPASGTLVFNDFEMSKTIVIPIVDDEGIPQPNRDFMVVLSNPRRDPTESPNVSAPRVDSIFGKVLCRILDCDTDPKSATTLAVLTTNFFPILGVTNVVTNTLIADPLTGELFEPTNAVFNFSKANYRIPRDVQPFWNGAPVTVYVNRMGTNTSSVTVHYRFDEDFLDQNSTDDDNNEFPLQPGSDYAVPTPPNADAIKGTNSDFAGVGGDTGSLTFPGGKNNPFQSQPIHFNVQNNHIPGFNKDIHITIYEDDSNNNPEQVGMVAETTVTILFDDNAPPAGSVDEFYNPDFATDMASLTNTLNLNTTVLQPGTEPLGDVYAVALAYQGAQVVAANPQNQAVIGGAFSTYTDGTNTYTANGLARLNPDGSLDPTFNSLSGNLGSGVNAYPGTEFIRSVALTLNNQVLIGGDFTSFDNVQRNNVARLNANGTLDTTFNPGAGANGQVWSVLAQADGKVLIGGEFTTYNGAAANYVARLNQDGSLDGTFNASNLLTGPVYAMALSADTPFNYSRASSPRTNEDDQVVNLNLQTAGTMNYTFDSQAGTNEFQIFYGTANVAAGTGVLLFDSGATFTGTVTGSVPFGPTGGFVTNILTVVVNPGGQVNGYSPWNYTLSMPGNTNLMIGGNFKVAGQFFVNVARLNTDGSLDATFNPGTGPSGPVLSLGWQPDGKVVVGGSFNSLSGVAANNLARLNADGSIDASFYNGTGADSSVNSLTLQPVSGCIYAGGPFDEINGTHRVGFARLNSDGTVDTSFLDMAYNQFAGLSRLLYSDTPGVYASALQSDGNVIIGGSFQEVGGGQADYLVRYVLESERGLQPSTTNLDLMVSEGGSELEPKTRDGVRNRSNLARLIGGTTGGPGNIGMAATAYAVNKTQLAEPVNLVRDNGMLGYASANFAVLPGLAKSGTDFTYSGVPPLYPISWEYAGPTRMHSDGQFGADGLMQDFSGEEFKYGVSGPASVLVNIINDTSALGNLNAQFQMSNPSQVDQFYLGGQDIPLGVALGVSQTPLTLVDNSHQDGVFGFASPSYVATNSLVSVAIARTNGTFGQVQVFYQTVTNGSTAVLNVDYSATNGYVIFNQGVMTVPFQVTVLNNSSTTSQEKDLNVLLYKLNDLSGGHAQLGLTNAVLRLINPNYAGLLSFDNANYSATVGAGVITFNVTRTVGSKGSLTVQYGTADGLPGLPPNSPLSARNGVDYIGSTNTLTWNSGDVSPRTVSIPLLNPNATGVSKFFQANLFNATLDGTNVASLYGVITNATLAIVNQNNYGFFQFSSPSYQYGDGNNAIATITVTRTGSALGTAQVNYATVNGTAFAGTNYVYTNSTLTFAPGILARSFNVQLLDDGRTNDPTPATFYFAVQLSSPSSGAYLGSPTNSLVHLVHGEQYNQPPGSVDLSFTAGVNASVLGLALQSDGQAVAVGNFTVADGTSIKRIARFGTNGTLDDSFLVGLAGADGAVNVVVSQTDDRVVVGGSFANVNSVQRPGLARLMTDGSLDTSFNPGAGADNPVFALAESFVNGNRVLYVGGAFNTYNTASSPGIVRLNNSGAVDNSFNVGGGAVGTVYAVAPYPTNSIYNAGQVLVGGAFTNFDGEIVGNLVRLNVDGSLDSNFTQNVSANGAVRAIAIELDGSVLIGGDFTNLNGAAVNHLAHLSANGAPDSVFNNLAAPGCNGTVNAIALQQDNRIVVAGLFSSASGVSRNGITRLLPTGAVDPTINFGAGANGAVNAVVIQPADGNLVIGGGFTQFSGQTCDYIARLFGGSETGSGAFQFTTANYQIDEDAGSATITIERTGGTSGPNADGSGDVYVAFTTANGSAVAGVNYSATTNYVAFPPGEVLQSVSVPVQDDGVITTNLTVNLSLSNPSPATGLGDQATAVLTIINDDNVVEFLSPTYSVPKNTALGYANIQVVRLGSTSGSCTVNFATTTNGTAVIGTDYFPTNELITFNPGVVTNSVQIVITNNGLPEGNETVTMILTNAFNTVLAPPTNAVLTIVDTSTNPGNLFFTQSNFTANATAGVAYLTVGRTNGTHGSLTADYTILPGTASVDLLSPTNGTVQLGDGISSGTIAIQLANNSLQPVSCSIYLTLPVTAPPGAGLVAPTNATLTIINNTSVFNFALATNTAAENQGVASIVVQRLNNAANTCSVNYATTNGTALAGVNYLNTFGTLTFGAGETVKSVAVPLFNRSNIVDLTFGMYLFSPTNGVLVPPSNTVVVLTPSAAGVSFITNASSVVVTAAAVPLLIPVLCSNPGVEPVGTSNTPPLEVSYFTADGSAKAGVNYSAASGTLVFANGVGTNYIAITIFNNNLVSSNLTFSVLLTNVTAPGQIAPFGTQTVTIIETNAGMSFSQANYDVFKNAGLATITVNRNGYTNSVASVNFVVTNGTAIGGQNFYPTNGTLVFTNGVTSQSFNVVLIANTLTQPNLFAEMQLEDPINAQIVNPGSATLTILETGGSYVEPAGAQLVANYTSQADMAADVIGSNDTVQVLFAFRDAAGTNVGNLVAMLLPTNGVTAPSPASQTYGPLTVYGHSVSKPFTFTARGTNTFTISPTFQLYDSNTVTGVGKYIGPATFVFTIGAWTTTLANSNPIVIIDGAAASLYPSLINASGLGNTLIKATVTLTNLSHQDFSDIDALVVSPTTNTLILAHAGVNDKVAHVTLTFDDAATNSLPQTGQILSGTNKPTVYGTPSNFP